MLACTSAIAQAKLSSETYTLGPVDINSGGEMSLGGSYVLMSSTGQAGGVGLIVSDAYVMYNGFWPPIMGSSPFITSWKSVRTHLNNVGDLAISLDPSKTDGDTGTNGPTVETRRYGVLQLQVSFSEAVQPVDGTLDVGDVVATAYDGLATRSVTPASVSLTNGDTVLAITFDSSGDHWLGVNARCTFDLAGKFKSAGLFGMLVTGDTDCQVRCLVGDINHTGNINLIDVGGVKSKAYAPVSSSTCIYDVNTDGNINLIDVALTKSGYGNTAP